MSSQELQKLIAIWFNEDIREGDHTSLSCIPATQMGCQQLIIKDTGIIAGIEVAKQIIAYFDSSCRVEQFLHDGDAVKPGDVAFKVYGKELSLLQIERTMLNIMQRMSGVATTAHIYQSRIADTKCHVLDTRKTTPGLRYLEKEAVKIGGGMNHRIGLFDMILLKDNHVDFAGGITSALTKAIDYCKNALKYFIDFNYVQNVFVDGRRTAEGIRLDISILGKSGEIDKYRYDAWNNSLYKQ